MRFNVVVAALAALGMAAPALAQQAGDRAGMQNLTAAGLNGLAFSLESGVVAEQALMSVVSNVGVDRSAADAMRRSQTGDVSVSGDAFSTFSGALTQSINTGTNASVQAATNIAIAGNLIAASRQTVSARAMQ